MFNLLQPIPTELNHYALFLDKIVPSVFQLRLTLTSNYEKT